MAWASLKEIGLAYRSGKIDKEQFEIALKWWWTNHPKRDVTPKPQHEGVVSSPRREFQQNERDEIVALYVQGMSMVEVAKKLGIGPYQVSRILSLEGVAIRPPGGSRPHHDYDEIISLYASGLSINAVSKRVGLSPGRIWQILKQEGHPRRPRGRHY